MAFAKKMLALDCRLDLTKVECVTLAVLSTVNFANGVASSLLSPFYPQEAEKRGAKASEYGLVFGIHDLVSFIACVFYGKYMDALNAKHLVNFGVIVSGFGSILFGLLDLVDSHFKFIGISFALSSLNALGMSASITAAYFTATVVLPTNVATSFAVLECAFGLGYALGPTFGGYLYEVGGFKFPLFTMAAFYLFLGVLVFLALPRVGDGSKADTPKAKIFSLLKMMPVTLSALTILAAYLSLGFYQAILEPHLRQFDLRPVTVGAIFSITSFTYTLTTPLVGRLCDTGMSPMKSIVFGSLLIIASFSLVGPLPFIPINTALWMVYLAMVLHGLGMSCIVVPGFIVALKSAVEHGLPDDVTTYGVVTAITVSSVALGDFIGPSVAGVLFDSVGFRQGTLVVIVIYIVLMVLMALSGCAARSSYPLSLDKGQINQGFSLTQLADPSALSGDCPQKPAALSQIHHSCRQKYGSSDLRKPVTKTKKGGTK